MKWFTSQTIKLTIIAGTLASSTLRNEAVIIYKDSNLFPKKFEMNTVSEGVDPNGDTTEWDRMSIQGSVSANLSGGLLNVDTTNNVNPGAASLWWQTNCCQNAIGSTIEARIRVDISVDSQSLNRVATFALGDANDSGTMWVGLNDTRWFNNTVQGVVIDSNPNSGLFHVFRIAQDANNSAQYQVWRDGEQIGFNLAGQGPPGFASFGDNTSGFGGVMAFDYVRYDNTGGFSIPEPTSLALIGLGSLLWLRRRLGME